MNTDSASGRSEPEGRDGDLTEIVGKMPDRPSAWLFSAIIGLIACLALIGSMEYHYQIRRWPLILSAFIVGCLALYAIEQALLVRKLRAIGRSGVRSPVDEAYGAHATLVTTVATATFGLFLLMAYLFSFLVATLFFVPAYMWVAGVRRPWTLAGVTAGMLVAVWLMFGRILFVPVEAGRFLDLHWLAP